MTAVIDIPNREISGSAASALPGDCAEKTLVPEEP
jgi:hypothetical protein